MTRVLAKLLLAAALLVPSMSRAGIVPAIFTASVQGIVIDADRRMPLAGVIASLVVENRAERKSTVTDKSGTFAFKGLQAGKYDISFQKDGYDVLMLTGLNVERGEAVTVNPALVLRKSKFTIIDYPMHPNACASLVQPRQTADVYVVCTDRR